MSFFKNLKMLFSFAIFAILSFFVTGEEFDWSAEKGENEIVVKVKIGENYYLYSDPTRIIVESGDRKILRLKEAPRSEKYIDEFLQENIIYKAGEHKWIFERNGAMPYLVKIRYQGCSKNPFMCYPPREKEIKIDDGLWDSAVNVGAEKLKKVSEVKAVDEEAAKKLSEDKTFIGRMSARGGWWIFFAAFIAGILSTLTPCVLPLIPITVAILSGGDKGEGKGGSFSNALLYVFGIIIMFTVLAVIAAYSGKAFGSQILGNRVVVIIFGVVFFILSLSMLGLYDLQLPTGLQTKLSSIGGGGLFGSFLMGLVAGLIAVPCTGPVLGTLLGIAAASANPIFSVFLLFSYACGFGVPFLVIASGAKVMPKKAGGMMEVVKSLLGIAIMVIAIFAFSIAIGEFDNFLKTAGGGYGRIFSLILIVLGFLFGAVHTEGHSEVLVLRGLKVLGAVLISFGLVWNLKLENAVGTDSGGIKWEKYGLEIFEKAGASKKNILLDFTAEWCVACKEMEATTFKDKRVIEEINQRWIAVKVDCTFNTPDVEQLIKKYGVKGFPGFVLMTAKGDVKDSFTGYHNAEEFLEKLRRVK